MNDISRVRQENLLLRRVVQYTCSFICITMLASILLSYMVMMGMLSLQNLLNALYLLAVVNIFGHLSGYFTPTINGLGSSYILLFTTVNIMLWSVCLSFGFFVYLDGDVTRAMLISVPTLGICLLTMFLGTIFEMPAEYVRTALAWNTFRFWQAIIMLSVFIFAPVFIGNLLSSKLFIAYDKLIYIPCSVISNLVIIWHIMNVTVSRAPMYLNKADTEAAAIYIALIICGEIVDTLILLMRLIGRNGRRRD